MQLEAARADPSAPPPTPRATDRGFADRDYNRLSELIGSHVGIKLPQTKRLMVEGRLRSRVRALGLSSVDDYCRHLFAEDGLEAEMAHLIDVVTTNKTDFFREPVHFDWLARRIVPELLAERSEREPQLKIWSAACSTGAEAYTIAMVLAELNGRLPPFRYSILGTDISTRVLDAARRAIYPTAMVGPVPRELQNRYLLTARRAEADEVRIAPELRRLVQFARLNLMDPSYPIDRDVDVIFLRNVLIYFDRATQEAVVRRLLGHLRPGGWLILGHSESMVGASLRLPQRAPSIFQQP